MKSKALKMTKIGYFDERMQEELRSHRKAHGGNKTLGEI